MNLCAPGGDYLDDGDETTAETRQRVDGGLLERLRELDEDGG